MSIGALLLLALSASADNFAVSLALGMSQTARIAKLALRLSVTFGLCQFLMPLLGWLAGSRVTFLFHGHERWPLFASLLFVGWRMLRSTGASDKARQSCLKSGGSILVLALGNQPGFTRGWLWARDDSCQHSRSKYNSWRSWRGTITSGHLVWEAAGLCTRQI